MVSQCDEGFKPDLYIELILAYDLIKIAREYTRMPQLIEAVWSESYNAYIHDRT